MLSSIYASVLDIQRETLAEDIWDKHNEKYELKEEIRDEIIDRVIDFCKLVFNTDRVDYVSGLYIISSIATYFYSEKTDIDIKIVLDYEKLIEQKPGLADIDWDTLLSFLIKKTKLLDFMSKPFSNTTRSIDWFFYEKNDFNHLVKNNTKRFDSIYDVVNKKFIKFTSKIEGISSTEIFDYALELAEDYLKNLDIDLGNLRRNIIQYDYYKDYLKFIDYSSEEIQDKLDEIIDNIEKSLIGIYEDKEYFSELRHNAFNKETLIGAYAKLYKSENFSDENLLRKILEYFGYWKVLVDLSEIYSGIEDGDLDIDDGTVHKIDEILKDF
jgi:hypothetical protein